MTPPRDRLAEVLAEAKRLRGEAEAATRRYAKGGACHSEASGRWRAMQDIIAFIERGEGREGMSEHKPSDEDVKGER